MSTPLGGDYRIDFRNYKAKKDDEPEKTKVAVAGKIKKVRELADKHYGENKAKIVEVHEGNDKNKPIVELQVSRPFGSGMMFEWAKQNFSEELEHANFSHTGGALGGSKKFRPLTDEEVWAKTQEGMVKESEIRRPERVMTLPTLGLGKGKKDTV